MAQPPHAPEPHRRACSITQYRPLTLAGISRLLSYLGSCLWGCAILVCSADPLAMQVMGCIVTMACVVTFFYAVCGKNKDGGRCTLAALVVVFGGWLGALSVMAIGSYWAYANVALEISLLLIAALNVLYATYDIYDDTMRRTVERSDAYQFAAMHPCMSARCVGATWFVLSLAATGLSVWAFLSITTATGGPPLSIDELPNEAIWYIFVPGPLVLATAILLHLASWCIPCADKVTQDNSAV